MSRVSSAHQRASSVAATLLLLLAVLLSTLSAPRAGAAPTPPGGATARLAASTAPGVPRARSFAGLRTVGPLFPPGSAVHTCTASVVASQRGDLLITAAHCLSGSGAGWRFAPGYHDGVEPYGSWQVVALQAPLAWRRSTSPKSDYAFAEVAPKRLGGRLRTLQEVVGANHLARAPSRGSSVSVPAYAAGQDDLPVTCTAPVSREGIYPTFSCDPYADGTSGAPWLQHRSGGTFVVGVIGGLHRGGCEAWTSYSAPFDRLTLALGEAAGRAAAAQRLPAPPGDGCTTGF